MRNLEKREIRFGELYLRGKKERTNRLQAGVKRESQLKHHRIKMLPRNTRWNTMKDRSDNEVRCVGFKLWITTSICIKQKTTHIHYSESGPQFLLLLHFKYNKRDSSLIYVSTGGLINGGKNRVLSNKGKGKVDFRSWFKLMLLSWLYNYYFADHWKRPHSYK